MTPDPFGDPYDPRRGCLWVPLVGAAVGLVVGVVLATRGVW